MSALTRPGAFPVLLIAAVLALVGTSWLFTFGAPWPWRIAGAALMAALWAGWVMAARARHREKMGASRDEALSPPDAAALRYTVFQAIWAAPFAISVVAAVLVITAVESPAIAWIVAAVPASLLAAWAWLFFRAVRSMDEMMQAASLKAVAISAGGVVCAASIWGMFEFMVGAPQFPAFLLLPVFSMIYGGAMSAQGVGRQ